MRSTKEWPGPWLRRPGGQPPPYGFSLRSEGRREYEIVVGERRVLITPGLTDDGRVDLVGLDESLAEFLVTR